jgi:hypothetical protein
MAMSCNVAVPIRQWLQAYKPPAILPRTYSIVENPGVVRVVSCLDAVGKLPPSPPGAIRQGDELFPLWASSFEIGWQWPSVPGD